MEVENLKCWRCGGALTDVLQPFARAAECPACNADLHVCKMCEFFDTGARRGCREPVADEVGDKERSNFCGYFQPTPLTTVDARASEGVAAQSGLADLFGLDEPAADAISKEAASRAELDKLFGLDDSSKS